MVRRQSPKPCRSDPKTGALIEPRRRQLATVDVHCGPCRRSLAGAARAIAEAAETAKQDQSKRTMVLSDIRDIFAARPGIDRLRSAEMADALGAMENRPWPEWRNGKPITPAALARLLGPFGITPGTKRDGDNHLQRLSALRLFGGICHLPPGSNRHTVTTQ